MMDNVYNVLILGESDKDNKYMGYTENMKLVNVKCNPDCLGKIIPVKIIDTKTWSLDGEVYEK